ncbi:MDR family oxidoreductase [Candidatus Chloroploca asiatica]|uniref:Acryloyl-CoA reductase n=1 Tax=Candidatus Chloroploca asiatica TaxID=1506545 RepID=A0A2H3KPL1_9CHLR|nr:MDR family oxidoreductase [Candidatus Chloroploca asiatica]PDW00211.1 acryloyl-CoA reductase [Candidatus Chloroploca asiatica]
MSNESFRALVVEEDAGTRRVELRDMQVADLPPGEVLVKVAYSTLNYKDGLAVTGKGKILRVNPMAPGIDFAGTVVESQSPAYKPGDEVVLTGWGVGERHWGGFSQFNRVKAGWLVPLPKGLTLQQAMAIGTAGFTAMLCVLALERHGLTNDGREVVVTGAAGGVGSVAVALLARAGYKVVASTGRPEEADYLRDLGAADILDRSFFTNPGRPLESERWAGAVDTVGGPTLGGIFRTVASHGVVAACGNAGGVEFTSSVFPFILRSVKLVGVESVMVPLPERLAAWERLARDLPTDVLDRMTSVIPLAAVPEYSETITQAQVRGRIVVDVQA